MTVPPKNLTMAHINWVLGGVMVAKDGRTGRIIRRYEPGSILVNEAIIDTSRPLGSNVIDLNKIDAVFKFMMSSTLAIHPVTYEVEKGSGTLYLLRLKNKDYLSLTEDFRKARHLRVAKFLQENCQGPLFRSKDNVWMDLFLRNMVIKHVCSGEIVYKEFEVPKYFFVLHSGVLAVEKQVEVQYSNLWPSPKKNRVSDT